MSPRGEMMGKFGLPTTPIVHSHPQLEIVLMELVAELKIQNGFLEVLAKDVQKNQMNSDGNMGMR